MRLKSLSLSADGIDALIDTGVGQWEIVTLSR
jgi:hypothetical protein